MREAKHRQLKNPRPNQTKRHCKAKNRALNSAQTETPPGERRKLPASTHHRPSPITRGLGSTMPRLCCNTRRGSQRATPRVTASLTPQVLWRGSCGCPAPVPALTCCGAAVAAALRCCGAPLAVALQLLLPSSAVAPHWLLLCTCGAAPAAALHTVSMSERGKRSQPHWPWAEVVTHKAQSHKASLTCTMRF